MKTERKSMFTITEEMFMVSKEEPVFMKEKSVFTLTEIEIGLQCHNVFTARYSQ